MGILKPKQAAPTPPKVLVTGRQHLLQEMSVGIGQDGSPYYVLKFEMITTLDGMQALLSSVQSDGGLYVQVLDGQQSQNNN